MRISRHFFLLYVSFFALIAVAQRPLLRNYSPQEYQAGSQNWCIDISSDYRIVTGNNWGMLMFDSRTWRTYRLPNYTTNYSLLCDDEQQRVWAGGSNEFGYFAYDGILHQLSYHSLLPTLKTKDEIAEVWRIIKLGKTIVFQTRNALLLYDGSTTSVVHSPELIDCVAKVENNIIVATKDGLLTLENNLLKPLQGTDLIKRKSIKAILPYRPSTMLLATETDGVFSYDGVAAKPFPLDITPFLMQNQVFCAAIKDDIIAFGTVRGGVVTKNMTTGVTSYVNRATGLRNNTVLGMCFDSLGNLWLGLDQGMAYVMMGGGYSNLLSDSFPIGTGYASLVHGNQLFLGTNQGIYYIPYPVPNGPDAVRPTAVNGLEGQAWCLTLIDGNVLCGNDHGAYVLRNNFPMKIPQAEGTWKFMPLTFHPGLVLACDYKSLYMLDRITFSWKGRVEGFNETSGMFFEDPDDGTIWLCHWQRGVFHLWLSDDGTRVVRQERFDAEHGLPVTEGNLLCQAGGKLYVSSPDGFRTYNHKTGKLEMDTTMTRLFNTYDQALNLYETMSGKIWGYKPHFLGLASPHQGKMTSDTLSYKPLADLLQTALGGFSALDSTHTLLNSGDGFLIVDHSSKQAGLKSQLLIETVTTFGDHDTLTWANNPWKAQQEISLPHNRNSLTVSFVMPEYMRPGDVLYQVYLEGYDKHWGGSQQANTKTYTQLPGGNYRLRIKAVNRVTGHIGETELDISVGKAWYETVWAWCIWIALGVALLLLFLQLLRRYELKKMRLVEAENERNMREQKAQFELEQHRSQNELNRLRAEQLELDLKHRSNELAYSTMNLARKNDILQSLDQQMDELNEQVWHGDSQVAITQHIKDIKQAIQANIQNDDQWEKFQENFNMVYDNFMTKLSEQFPQLKTNDKKLCAYLRMHLSSKEIAALLNCSVRSVETARYRLRKKLGLGQGDNLTDFLQHF